MVEYFLSSVRLQGKDKTQSCKPNDKKTTEKFNKCIDKETKCSNNSVGEFKNVCEIEKQNVR